MLDITLSTQDAERLPNKDFWITLNKLIRGPERHIPPIFRTPYPTKALRDRPIDVRITLNGLISRHLKHFTTGIRITLAVHPKQPEFRSPCKADSTRNQGHYFPRFRSPSERLLRTLTVMSCHHHGNASRSLLPA